MSTGSPVSLHRRWRQRPSRPSGIEGGLQGATTAGSDIGAELPWRTSPSRAKCVHDVAGGYGSGVWAAGSGSRVWTGTDKGKQAQPQTRLRRPIPLQPPL